MERQVSFTADKKIQLHFNDPQSPAATRKYDSWINWKIMLGKA
jgi:hypothetical protein